MKHLILYVYLPTRRVISTTRITVIIIHFTQKRIRKKSESFKGLRPHNRRGGKLKLEQSETKEKRGRCQNEELVETGDKHDWLRRTLINAKIVKNNGFYNIKNN